MKWLYYLLEANGYLLIFYGFYCLALKKETFYQLNRWFLITATGLSFLLPLVKIEHLVNYTSRLAADPVQLTYRHLSALAVSAASAESQRFGLHLGLTDALLSIYSLVTLLLIGRLGRDLLKIARLYRNSDKSVNGKVTHVILEQEHEAFSFFSWLFYHPSLAPNQAVFAHELVHIRQKHSADLLAFELLKAVCWFNPVITLIVKDVKINHEYLADDQAARQGLSKYEYARLLITYACKPKHQLSHAIFNERQLEKRLRNLQKPRSAARQLSRYLLLIPLTGALLLLSAYTIPKDYALLTYHSNGLRAPKSTIKVVALAAAIKNVSQPIIEQPAADLRINAQLKQKHSVSELAAENEPSPVIAGGKKPLAADYLFDWLVNNTGADIRKIRHSILSGTEAQLFRGKLADTLYVDEGNYSIDQNTVELKTAQLMVGPAVNSYSGKSLVIVDAQQRVIVQTLPKVEIKLKGAIHEVKVQPAAAAAGTSKMELMGYNNRVQYAMVTANGVITDKEDPKAPYQPGIIW
jgi:hypothetical protein